MICLHQQTRGINMKLKDFPDDFSDDELTDLDWDEEMEEEEIEDDEIEDEDGEERYLPDRRLLFVIPSVILAAALIFLGVKLFSGRGAEEKEAPAFTEEVEAEPIEEPAQKSSEEGAQENGQEEAPSETQEDQPDEMEQAQAEDPQEQLAEEEGAETDMSQVQAGEGENENVSVGIDVARYQGVIDWQQVAASGVQFAMIRVGYRTQSGGEICEDSTAKYNMQEATKNGIKIGAYFFSTAVNEAEAKEEADWTADYISQYQITYPVAYNCEGYSSEGSRQFGLDRAARSDAAFAFLDRISERGYTPMFYAAKNEMEGDRDWDVSAISAKYKIWVSQYPQMPFPQTEKSSYSKSHAMWQYTNRGTIPGIPKNVDMNVAYFGYDETAAALNSEAPEEVVANVEALVNFTEVDETVTAKDVVNLRDRPGQGADSVVLGTLANGTTAQRTGISDSGWSRLLIDGQKVYAVSSFLTTDTSYVTPDQTAAQVPAVPDNGIKTQFASVNESVTAKIEVNLRTLPSVTNPDAAVSATLKYGEWITRTGISDNGWSRVEYNGQTLYCISSYLSTAP